MDKWAGSEVSWTKARIKKESLGRREREVRNTRETWRESVCEKCLQERRFGERKRSTLERSDDGELQRGVTGWRTG